MPKNSSKSKIPLVSFVIRTKNESLWIEKVLKTLLQQSFKNFEVIIVDSGSSDKTLELSKNFLLKLFKSNQKNLILVTV